MLTNHDVGALVWVVCRRIIVKRDTTQCVVNGQLSSNSCEADKDALNAASGTTFRCVSLRMLASTAPAGWAVEPFLVELVEFKRLLGIDDVLVGDHHCGASRDGVVGG